MTLSSSVVESHTDLATKFRAPSPSHETASCGRVYDYTREVFSLGLLYLDFKDAIREGDGNRVMRDWKYFLLIFKATGHKNYALEALTLLSQYFVTLPTNLAAQIKWSRFVNVHGLPGRIVKTAIEGLGANKTDFPFSISWTFLEHKADISLFKTPPMVLSWPVWLLCSGHTL